MIKSEAKYEKQNVALIVNIITRIKAKLISLGYSVAEVKEKILQTIGKVYKFKCESDLNLQKLIMAKLEGKKLNKKVYERIIIELDLLHNSIYDNFESES